MRSNVVRFVFIASKFIAKSNYMFNYSSNNFLFNLVKGKPSYVVAAYIFSFSSTIFSLLAIVLLIPILFFVLAGKADLVDGSFSYFVKQLLMLCDYLTKNYSLNVLIGLACLASAIGILLAYVNSLINIRHTQYMADKLKSTSFNLLSKVDISYFDRRSTDDILFKINREIDKSILAVKSSHRIINILINLSVFSLTLILISLKLTLTVIVLLVFGYYVNKILNNYFKTKKILLSRKSRECNRQTIDFLTGIDYIKSTANESEACQNIIKTIKSRSKTEVSVVTVSSSIESINQILGVLIVSTVSIACYHLYDGKSEIFLPILLAYLLILFKLLLSVDRLNTVRLQRAGDRSSIEIVDSFLTEISRSTIKSGTAIFSKLKYKIELQNVTFAYPHHAQIVLDKINISIAKGDTVALVGSSGAGKSTLVSLLPRLYEPIEGRIIIDKRDITEYSVASLRKAIAIVSEETFLFNNSILYNLTYGLNNVTKSEVIAACELTKIYNFIAQLSKGLDSKISDREVALSEAQRLLIAITRALLSNPEIVILDEPMKNVSKPEQEVVQHALDELCRDRTTIVITNRLTAIEKASQIIILNKGKAVESGTHQELLKNGNLYKKMCSAQFKTSQQSHQQLLAKKISRKLSRQNNNVLSSEIKNNLGSLLNYLQLINEGLVDDNLEQERILDESYQSAKNMLASLREYQKRISRGFYNG